MQPESLKFIKEMKLLLLEAQWEKDEIKSAAQWELAREIAIIYKNLEANINRTIEEINKF